MSSFSAPPGRYIFDDYYGDERPDSVTTVPTFLPAVNQWDPIGGTCASCTTTTNLIPPIDATKAQNGTWHSTTVSPDEPKTTISINFNGTGVIAYCILPPDLGPDITSYMNMSFMLDGNTVGRFERTSSGSDWTYNFPVYTASNLENKEHTFVVQPRADVNTSFLVFDYFTYDYDGPPPVSTSSSTSTSATSSSGTSSSSSSLAAGSTTSAANNSSHSKEPVGAIAGGVIGGVIFLLGALLALWYVLWRRTPPREEPIVYEAKPMLDDGSYPPPPVPFLSTEPTSGSVASREQPPGTHPAGQTSDYTASGSGSMTLLSSSSQWPSSAEGKRALADASLQRMMEMERQVAQDQGRIDSEANQRLQREIDALKAQVQQLNAALEQQAEEIRQAAYFDEAPPSYESGLPGLDRRSTIGRS